MKLSRVLAFIVVLVSSNVAANSDLIVEITRGLDDPTRVAVAPFGWSGSYALTEDVAQVVSDDLIRTGEFSPVSRADMLAYPALPQEVNIPDWRKLRAQYLVIGNMSPRGDRVALDFALYDVTAGRLVLTGEIERLRSDLRDMGHELANRVYEQLTGFPGIFRTKLAYIRAERDNLGDHIYRLVVADQDGHRERTVMRSRDPIMSPAWSPDGSELAFVSFDGGRPGVYRQNLLTGELTQLTNYVGLNSAPAWSPDGSKLAIVLSKDGDPEIYLLDVATKRLDRVTHHYAIDTEPAWIDNNSLIFTSNRGGRPQIYKILLDSGRLERLTFTGDYNARGRISPDGKYLVMVHRENGVFKIAAQDLATRRVHVLTETSLDESPTIAPNGRVVMYATRDGDKGILSAVAIDGGVRVKLPAAVGDIREPAWSPVLQN
ncbi:MAG: Tol-Pal system beta propeller repeat protein TolB [Pseudomonadales bacterium]|jgi:TolB protein